jgi:hypothetical protein
MGGRCSIPDVGRGSSRRLVVGPWEVLLVVTAWTVSYFCMYFQAAVFLSSITFELVTEVFSQRVTKTGSEFSSDYPACILHLFCLHVVFRSSIVQFFWL